MRKRPPATKRRRGPAPSTARRRARDVSASTATGFCFAFAMIAAAFALLLVDDFFVGLRCVGWFELFFLGPLWIAFRRGALESFGVGARVVLAATSGFVALACLLAQAPNPSNDSAAQSTFGIAAALLVAAFLATPVIPVERDPEAAERRRERIPALRRWEEDRAHERERLGFVLLACGILAAAIAAAGRDDFLRVGPWPGKTFTLGQAVLHDPKWATVAATVVGTPLWYVAWRLRGLSNGRVVGVLLGATIVLVPAAIASQKSDDDWFGGQWGLLVCGAFFAAAFAAAPRARDPDATDAFLDWQALRRHRKSFPDAAR